MRKRENPVHVPVVDFVIFNLSDKKADDVLSTESPVFAVVYRYTIDKNLSQ